MMSATNGLAAAAAVAALLIATVALLAAHLRTEGYGLPASLVLGGLAIGQPAFAIGVGALHTALLAAITCAIGVCAVALAKEQSARRIILLGGSLAGAQLVDLSDGIATALMLPAVLCLPRSRADAERTLGLYVLLLFLPTLVLLGRLYLVWLGPSGLPQWSNEPWPGASDRMELGASAAGIVFLPVLLQTLAVAQSTAVSAVLSLGAAVLVAALVSFPAGAICAVAAILPSLAILLIGQWPQSSRRSREALQTVAAGTAVAWIYEFVVQAVAHA